MDAQPRAPVLTPFWYLYIVPPTLLNQDRRFARMSKGDQRSSALRPREQTPLNYDTRHEQRGNSHVLGRLSRAQVRDRSENQTLL